MALDVLDVIVPIPSIIHGFQKLLDPHASAGDRWWAAGSIVLNALTIIPPLKIFKAVKWVSRAVHVANEVDKGVTVGSRVASVASKAADVGAEACRLSFAADTAVATPTGEQAIGTLHAGDQVTAYDPETGQSSTQTVQHVWVNHDSDLLDVTLRSDSHPAATTGRRKERQAAVAVHGAQAPPASGAEETIHTTEKHPWLTVGRGWIKASELRLGERVVRLDGATATVVGLHERTGEEADYYNLTVSEVHTYAVGAGQFVVHNCNVYRDPATLKFTQDAISRWHSDGHSVQANIKWLQDNPGKDLPAVDIFTKTSATDGLSAGRASGGKLRNGEWYSLDNRRLYEYQQAGRNMIPVNIITEDQAVAKFSHWTTDTWGDTIRFKE
jgi:hypothetical protein